MVRKRFLNNIGKKSELEFIPSRCIVPFLFGNVETLKCLLFSHLIITLTVRSIPRQGGGQVCFWTPPPLTDEGFF